MSSWMILALLAMPAVWVFTWVGFKMSDRVKAYFHKIPAWLSALVISLFISHVMLSGVIATWAGLVLDLLLWPGFLFLKWLYERKTAKRRASGMVGAPSPA